MNQELEYRLLKILESQPSLTQRQIAKELGVSLGKTHYLIKSLIDVGWVKFTNFRNSKNKLGYAYLLTPKGIIEKSETTKEFLIRKKKEHVRILEEIKELQEELRSQQKNDRQRKLHSAEEQNANKELNSIIYKESSMIHDEAFSPPVSPAIKNTDKDVVIDGSNNFEA